MTDKPQERSIKYTLDEVRQILEYFGYEVNARNIEAIRSDRTLVLSSMIKAVVKGRTDDIFQATARQEVEKLIAKAQKEAQENS